MEMFCFNSQFSLPLIFSSFCCWFKSCIGAQEEQRKQEAQREEGSLHGSRKEEKISFMVLAWAGVRSSPSIFPLELVMLASSFFVSLPILLAREK